MTDQKSDLRAAIDELVRRKKSKEVPDRQLVRLAILALGRLVLGGDGNAARELAKELNAAAEPHGERWTEAVESEMGLAVAEHVHSADPRYLDLATYDFEYAIAARERLEARLQALEVLGLSVAETLLEQVEAADQRLRPYLESKS